MTAKKTTVVLKIHKKWLSEMLQSYALYAEYIAYCRHAQ